MNKRKRNDMAQIQPLVSVIMPAYNAEKYIENSIRSVISQTYTNWELLVLDDCSTDQTAEIAEHFASVDSRIRVLHNSRNMGVARTRNNGLDLVKGQWIALLDSDDVWHDEKLQKQLHKAEESGADIIYCSYSMIDENAEHMSDYIVSESTSYSDMLKESVISCSTALLRQSVLSYHRFSTDYYHEDYAFWLELLKSGCRAVAVKEVLADYRVVQGSRSSNKLKSARNRWLMYRQVEKLPLARSVGVFTAYALHGIAKYRRG